MPNILIVEDEPAMRLGLKDNLEFESYTVEVAIDGQEGLETMMTSFFATLRRSARVLFRFDL